MILSKEDRIRVLKSLPDAVLGDGVTATMFPRILVQTDLASQRIRDREEDSLTVVGARHTPWMQPRIEHRCKPGFE
jgi:hypothetical protein